MSSLPNLMVAAHQISVQSMVNLISQANQVHTLEGIVDKQRVNLRNEKLEHIRIMSSIGKEMDELRTTANTIFRQTKHVEELLAKTKVELAETLSGKEAAESAETKAIVEIEGLENFLIDIHAENEHLIHRTKENRNKSNKECARSNDKIMNLNMQLAEKKKKKKKKKKTGNHSEQQYWLRMESIGQCIAKIHPDFNLDWNKVLITHAGDKWKFPNTGETQQEEILTHKINNNGFATASSCLSSQLFRCNQDPFSTLRTVFEVPLLFQ